MHIAIIGAGNVGGALGAAWAREGYTISYGVIDPGEARHQKAASAAGNAKVRDVREAVSAADVIVVAVPWDAVPAALEACGDLSDRVVLDATNPLTFGENGLELALGFTTSGAEEIARLAPGARVYKTMNQVGFEVMADASGFTAKPVMFVAGADGADKDLVRGLVKSIGFEDRDAGPLKNARLLEPYAMLWIDQAIARGAPTTNAFAMLEKEQKP